MRAAAQVWVIGDEGVAFVYLIGAVSFKNARGASGECAHVKRQHDMLRDHFAVAVQNRAARILLLADNRRVAGAKKRVLHFLDDTGEAGLNDL
jgi:hypothetical protein